MIIFFVCVALLITGYFTYGVFVERIFKIQIDRPTPAYTETDGVDYMPMKRWRVIFIQFLNIAGVGPVFGPILGAVYGPSALLWIVIGSIFAGGVHDYFSGMMSVRHKGESIPEVIGDYMGTPSRWVMRVFSVVLLMLVGVIFVTAPADLLTKVTGHEQILGLDTRMFFIVLIFIYYFIATILPINQIIGRLYPFFGLLLVVMTFALFFGLLFSGKEMLPNHNFFQNVHPKSESFPIWPLIFITISCGALSGFHSTQSPLMARCIQSEKDGRPVFYGSMIIEGIVALIWATIGMSFFYNPGEPFSAGLAQVISEGGPANVVATSANALLGGVGGALAMLAVIVLPITSGDTAFRSTRLIFADMLNLKQGQIRNRLLLALPLFAMGVVLTFVDFHVIWRYFGFSNQALSTTMLWAGAAFLVANGRASYHWMCSLPAAFMTAVCSAYILSAKIGFNINMDYAQIAGIIIGVVSLGLFIAFRHKIKPETT
ncbi:MAG: carbon starvation protein A [Alphaproteobacteria bacterium]